MKNMLDSPFKLLRSFACILSAAAVLASVPALAQERTTERVPTPFVESGKPVTLEVIVFKPPGPGPFPTLLFNHGSTGTGNDSSLFKRTWVSEPVARFFNERGWLVAFPQRRGRGQSDGLYDEGFTPDRRYYSCDPTLSLAGLERALADIDAAVAWLQARPDVDGKRMLIGGQSRGGILAIAYAGTRPAVFQGAINFVGGWMSDKCPGGTAEAINTPTFRRGAPFAKPTLWLYGENDSFYALSHSRKNFDAFVAAGGRGEFLPHTLSQGVNGHFLIGTPGLWAQSVETYLTQSGR